MGGFLYRAPHGRGMTGSGGRTIGSVANALELLEALRVRERAGVTELSEAVDLSPGSVHHHLATLREAGFVEGNDGEYRLGLRSLSYGGAARERETVFRIGKSGVDRLARETGETARLVVERGGYGITLYQATRDERSAVRTHLGTQQDLHCTAAGKAMLSAMDEATVDDVLGEGPLERYTERTTVDPGALRAELDGIGAEGVAFDDEEQFEGVRRVATVLVSEEHALLGAIGVSGPVDRIDDATFREELPRELRNVAGAIEIDAAYLDWL